MPLSRPRRLTLTISIFEFRALRASLVWMLSSVISCPLRGGAHGRVDTLIAAAATDVARHGLVDLGIGRARRLGEERRRLHDLLGLAVAALGHAILPPGDLHGVIALGAQALDGDDRLAGQLRHRRHAGAHGRAVDMHGAVAAKRGATSEFGAR